MTQLNKARSSTSSEKGVSGRGFESAPIRTGDVKPRWYGRAEEASSRKGQDQVATTNREDSLSALVGCTIALARGYKRETGFPGSGAESQ